MEERSVTLGGGEGRSDPVAQVGSSVGPNQLVADSFHHSETLVLPGTFRQQTLHLYLFMLNLIKATGHLSCDPGVSTEGLCL